MLVNQITPGHRISGIFENGFGSEKKEMSILGNEVGWRIPIKMTNGNGTDYLLISRIKLENILSKQKVKINSGASLSTMDKNIGKIFACSSLWSLNGAYKPSLREGIRFWLTFNDKTIEDISFQEPSSDKSYVELRAGDKYSLATEKINKVTPQGFYEFLETTNWLIEQLRDNISNGVI